MVSIVSRSSVFEVMMVMVIKLNILVGSCFCIFLIIATNFNLYDFKLKKIWFSYHFAQDITDKIKVMITFHKFSSSKLFNTKEKKGHKNFGAQRALIL